MESKFNAWLKDFQKATDFDGWGQPIEAAEIYSRLSKQLLVFIKTNSSTLDEKTEEQGQLMAKQFESRANDLRCFTDEHITLLQIRDLLPILNQFISQVERRQSLIDNANNDLARLQSRALSLDTGDVDCDRDDQDNLLYELAANAIPYMEPNKTYLTISIDKIGIKEAEKYKSPFIVMSVKDFIGIQLAVEQTTPCSSRIEGNWIHFHTVFHINKAIEDMPLGFAIFFEFKHYKFKKNFNSTKCYAFLEKDEIKKGPALLELYRKPTDFRRRNLHLLTTKQLFLHLDLYVSTGKESD